MENLSFDEYVLFLIEAMENISEYGMKIGKPYPRAKKVVKKLNNPDPFIVYQALQDASLILEDDLLFH